MKRERGRRLEEKFAASVLIKLKKSITRMQIS